MRIRDSPELIVTKIRVDELTSKFDYLGILLLIIHTILTSPRLHAAVKSDGVSFCNDIYNS